MIWRDDRLLLLQQLPRGPEPPIWDLPSTVVDAWESAQAALARGIEQSLGVRVRTGEVLAIERGGSAAPERDPETHYIRCELESFEFRPSAPTQTWRWVRPPDLGIQEVAPCARAFVRRLAES